MITPRAEDLFDLSASDANIPAAAAKGVRTRDKLKQLIESSCEMADEIGTDARVRECTVWIRVMV